MREQIDVLSSKSDVKEAAVEVNPPDTRPGIDSDEIENVTNKEEYVASKEDYQASDDCGAGEEGQEVEILHNPIIATFKDHFSLTVPTSRIRFRQSAGAARVIESEDDQFIIEEKYSQEAKSHVVTIKKVGDSSEGLRSLNFLYTLVAAFWTGFVFTFSLQILLFLGLDLAVSVGLTQISAGKEIKVVVACILSFPLFVYSLATGLVMSGAFVVDTWKGHLLVRNFTLRQMKAVEVEWVFFAFFLGIPVFVLAITLMMRLDSWLEVTGLFWLCCVALFFFLFSINVIFYEVNACWEIVKNYYKEKDAPIFTVLKQCILFRQVATYSGRRDVSFLSRGCVVGSDDPNQENEVPETRFESKSIQAHLTSCGLLYDYGLYKKLDPPQQCYSIEDALDFRPFVTSHSWSLEKIFCRPNNSRYIAIIEGPGAITHGQMMSSLACSLMGTFLILFLMAGILVYVEAWKITSTFVLVIFMLFTIPRIWGTLKLYKIGGKLHFATNGTKKNDDVPSSTLNRSLTIFNSQHSTAVYLVTQKYRINKPTATFCWCMFAVEIFLFYLYPLFGILLTKNYTLGFFFLGCGALSGLRYYINAALVLEETGDMSMMVGRDERETWIKRSRLNDIVGNISRGRSHTAWVSVLGVFGLLVLALFFGAINTGPTVEGANIPLIPLYDFEYVRADDSVRYPSCRLSSDIAQSPLNSLSDFAFLASLAYSSRNQTQMELDAWFGTSENGSSFAVDNSDLVLRWRESNNETSPAVSFKLVTFPSLRNYAFVLIRGTVTPWDMLIDGQTWAPALMLQGLRLFLPFGFIWTPVMPDLIKSLMVLESDSIQKVSFYRTTTKFVNFIKTSIPTTYGGVAVTGHSLGGGLALITGAQSHVPGIGLSAPNAMLSRKSFVPPVRSEDLNSKTFNIIPARDVVPMADDPAQNFQQIRCTTKQSDILGCHTATRSLCELLFNCGSGPRPVPCICSKEFGYPDPMPKPGTNRTFVEACSTFVAS